MITIEDALYKLKRFWRVDELKFNARFKKVTANGKSTHGYFEPFTDDYPRLRYPATANVNYNRNVSLIYNDVKDLIDGGVYTIELELRTDEARLKSQNPYLLKVKAIQSFTEEQLIVNESTEALATEIERISKEYLNISSPYLAITQANSVSLLSTDIYSENIRFMYELIQNADDASLNTETTVSIQIINNYVIISHHGKPFTPRDLRGLCSVGLGVKSNDITKTGYKGIGFKSVFGQPDGLVYVKSGATLFRFDKNYIEKNAWRTTWGNQEDWEKEYGKFNAPWQIIPLICSQTDDHLVNKLLNKQEYPVSTVIKIPDANKLYNDMLALFKDARVLLFLRRVSKIELSYNQQKVSIHKDAQKETRLVTIYKDNTVVDTYYVYKRTIDIPENTQHKLKQDPKTPAKIQNMVRAEFSIAVCLDKKNTSVRLLSKQEAPIYSFLPTSEVDFEFPFLVNANFILDASRQKIDKDHIWNYYLFHVIGNQIVELCSELAENKLYLDNYLSLLSKGFYNRGESLSLYERYDKGLLLGLRDIPFIINKNSDLVRLSQVCIDDLGLLDNQISKANEIVTVLNNGYNVAFLEENFFTNNESLSFLKKLGVTYLSSFTDFLKKILLSEVFQKSITIDNNTRILKFLMDLDKSDPTNSWGVIILYKPFILNSNNTLSTIANVCYPENAFDQDPEFANELIQEAVYNEIIEDTSLKEWLDKKGVTSPSSISFLEKEIISHFPQSINEENYLKITSFILRLHINDQLSSSHYDQLQNLPLKTQKGFVAANACIFSSVYEPKFNFEEIDKVSNLLDEIYLNELDIESNKIKEFFKRIHVIDDLDYVSDLLIHHYNLPIEYTNLMYEISKKGHVYPHLIGVDNARNSKPLFKVQSFSFIENVTTKNAWKKYFTHLMDKFSVKYDETEDFTWSYTTNVYKNEKYIISNKLKLQSVLFMSWGNYANNLTPVENYLFWFVRNKKIIPTKSDLMISKEVFVNSEDIIDLVGNYLPTIDLDIIVTEGWAKLLGLKTIISNDDIFKLLSIINKDLYVGKRIKKENIIRLGLLYKTLIKRLSNDKDKFEIKKLASEWILKDKLFAIDLTLQSVNNLIWVKEKEFEINEESMKSILLPNNVDKEDKYFIDFLNIFNIRIVDNVSYISINPKEDLKTKLKVLDILPFVAFKLVEKYFIKDVYKYISERVNDLSSFKFEKCEEIKANLSIDEKNVEGPSVKHNLDVETSGKLSSTLDFSSHLFILDFAKYLSIIFKAKHLQSEIIFALTLSEKERITIIKDSLLDSDLIQKLFDNKYLFDLKSQIEQKIKSHKIDDDYSSKKIENIVKESHVQDYNKVTLNSTIDDKFTFFKDELELAEFNTYFKTNLSLEDSADWNLFAIFKAIKYYQKLGYNMDESILNPENLIRKKFFQVEKNNKVFTIYPRSARQNYLYVGIQLWEALNYEDSNIFIVTDNLNCEILSTKEQLINNDKFLYFRFESTQKETRINLVDKIFNEESINSLKYSSEENAVLIIKLQSKGFASDRLSNSEDTMIYNDYPMF